MANEQVNVTLNIQAKVDEAVSGAKKITDELSKINLPDSVKSKITKTFSDIEKTAGKVGEALNSGFKQKGDVTAYNKNMERLDTLFKQLQKDIGGIDLDVFKKSFNFDTKPIEEAKTKLAEMQAQLQQQKGAAGLNDIAESIKKLNSVSQAPSIEKYAQALRNLDPQGMAAALNSLELGYRKINQESDEGRQKAETYREALDGMRQGLETVANNPGMSELNRQIEELKVEIEQIKADEMERFANAAKEASTANIDNVAEGLRKSKEEANGLPEKIQQTNAQLDQIKNKITHFFGLANGVNLFKRAVSSAFETVKELDKAMTETAVVTDFSVGDMWSQLPEHTKRANELGVSIKGLYEAETIYYQQGLKTNEVQAITNATLKMARIAGLDAAEATDRMTNALRGFNMEINQTNADNVADVYSKLAAMSASNVDEISTAMTKVASLASSANMSFENTAAFLSQIVETTRERAETAGTALKTIIARFTEVKELYNQGQFTGIDGEGEAIEVNKVAKALQSAGINMNEFFAGTKGLDQVFMELASKWDSLDAVQQRYIATMAAGSRQQSRFIAMMSDYKRTQELTTAANNASGASNEQYEKTLESLETKLTRLENAWNEFLMTLANNDLIKGAVDALTWLINAINDTINWLSGGGGLIKTILSVGAIIGALKLGSWIASALFADIGAIMNGEGMAAADHFRQGFATGIEKIKTLFSKDFWVGITPELPPFQTEAAVQSLNNVKLAEEQVIASNNNLTISQNLLNSANEQNAIVNAKLNATERQLITANNQLQKSEQQLTTATRLRNNAVSMNIKNEQVLNELNKKVAAAEQSRAKTSQQIATLQAARAKQAQQVAASETIQASATKAVQGAQAGVVAAESGRIASATALGAALGFNTAQQGLLNTMVAAGIPGETAAMAISAGMTAALYNEMAAKVAMTGATGAEAKAKLQSMIATYNELTAEQTSTATQRIGLLTRLALYAQILFGTKATKQSALAKLQEAGASGAQAGGTFLATLAQEGFNAALKACPLMWIIPLLIVLIGLIFLVADAINKSTPEAKLEAAKEAAENASNAADHAAESYQNLSDSWDSLSDKYSALDDMTKGTREWNAAVQDINSDVLDLIDQYGELADAVEMDEDGVLRIDENVMEEVLDREQKESVMAQSAAIAAKQKVTEAQTKVDRKNAFQDVAGDFADGLKGAAKGAEVGGVIGGPLGALYGGLVGGATGTAQNAALWGSGAGDELAQLVASGKLIGKEEVQAYADSIGLLVDITDEDVKALKAFGDSLNEAEVQNQAYLTAMAGNAIQMAEVPEEMSEYSSDLLGPEAMGRFQEKAEALEEDITKENRDEKREEYAKMMGYENYEAYKKDNGDKDISDEDLKKQLAAAHATEMAAEGLTDLTEHMDEAYGGTKEGKKKAKQFKAAISGNVSDMTAAEIKEMQGKSMQDYAAELGMDPAEMAADLGYTVQLGSQLDKEDQRAALKKLSERGELGFLAEGALGGRNIDELTDEEIARIMSMTTVTAEVQMEIDMEQATEQAQKELDEVNNKLANQMGTQASSLLQGQTVEVLKNISGQVSNMSKEAAANYARTFEGVVSQVSDPQKAQDLANYLSTIDPTNMTQVSEAMEYMQSMGLDTATIKNYFNAITDGAHTAYSSLQEVISSMDALTNKLKSWKDVTGRLEGGTGTFEDVTELLNAGMKLEDFTFGAEGWQLSADKIAEATKRMNEYNAEAARAEYEQTKEEVEGAQALKGFERAVVDENGNILQGQILKKGKAVKISSLKHGEDSHRIDDLVDIVAEASGEGENVYWRNWAESHGYDPDNYTDEQYEEYLQMIEDYYNKYVNLVNNGADIELAAKMKADFTNAARYGLEELEEMERQGETITEEMYNQSAEKRAVDMGLDSKTVLDYADALQEANTEMDRATALEVALGNMKMNKGLEEVINSYKDWTALIDKSTGLLKANSADDQKIINSLKKSIQLMLGDTGDLSDAFFENAENIELMKRAAEGDEKALGELQRAAAQDYIVNVLIETTNPSEEAEKALNELNALFEDFDFPKLEPGEALDNQDFINKCNDLIKAGKLTSEQVQTLFSKMGYDVELTNISSKPTARAKTYARMKRSGMNVEETGNDQIDAELSSAFEGEVSFPAIKVVTSKGSNGGGINEKNRSAAASNRGSGGGDKSKNWTNPYDELYNLEKKINEQIRIREKLERRYDKLLESRKASSKDILKAAADQYKALEKEKKLQEEMLAGRKKQLRNIDSRTYEDSDGNRKTYKELGVTKYASITENGLIQIDWDAINKVKDEETGKAIEAYIKELEEIYGKVEDAEKALDEIEDKLEDLRKKSIEQYLAFEERLVQALVQQQQNYIDDLQKISDKISEQNEKVISNLQESVDLERQIRDNTKTEEDIEKKEQRLAYLRRDTSGANQTEILQLEKELKEARESYQDTLTDQAIQKLSDDNAKAQEAREKMIQVLQDQLDWDQKHGTFGPEAERMAQEIAEAKDKGLEALMETDGVKLLQSVDGYEGKTLAGRLAWWNELLLDSNSILEGFNNTLLDIAWLFGKQIKVYDENTGKYITLTPGEKEGSWIDENGKEYKPSGQNTDFVEHTSDWIIPKDQEEPKTEQKTTETESETARSYFDKAGDNPWGDRSKKSKIENFQRGLNILLGKIDSNFKPLTIDGAYGPNTKAAAKKAQKAFGMSSKEADGLWGPKTTKAYHNSKYKAYKTGGLVDFTGPAWLDGSKSKPELVLNSRDTKSFLALKDVLSSFMHSAHSTQPQNMGDLNFDIKVDANIDSDYSVDEMLDRIKQQIVNDASYRNINVLNWIR